VKTIDHEFGGKITHTNFKQSYLEILVKKSGPRGLDGNMEERIIGWDNKCWMMLSRKGPKRKNI